MKTILKPYLSKTVLNYGLIIILFLSSFGIYLGRFLRYNSWEIISNSNYLLNDIINIVIQPSNNKEAWFFTILFSAFLNIGYLVFKTFNKSTD